MRHLTQLEIARLEGEQHCASSDWSRLLVSDTFDPSQVTDVTFVGDCSLGDLSGSHVDRFGIERHNGLRSVLLRDTTVGDGAYIAHVRDCISRYDIGRDVTITHTDAIYMSGSSRFGNGTLVPVLNETGGIEVPLSRRLTAQLAYLLVTLPRAVRSTRPCGGSSTRTPKRAAPTAAPSATTSASSIAAPSSTASSATAASSTAPRASPTSRSAVSPATPPSSAPE